MSQILVLGADYCPFCTKVKTHLENSKVPFEWVDTETEKGAKKRKQLSEKHKWKTIPMVFVKGEFIGGSDEFFKVLEKNKMILPRL